MSRLCCEANLTTSRAHRGFLSFFLSFVFSVLSTRMKTAQRKLIQNLHQKTPCWAVSPPEHRTLSYQLPCPLRCFLSKRAPCARAHTHHRDVTPSWAYLQLKYTRQLYLTNSISSEQMVGEHLRCCVGEIPSITH